MFERLRNKRDFYAGLLMALFGLVAALEGGRYNVGTLMQMGPGFFPIALGVLLVLLGILIAGTGLATPDPGGERILPDNPQWRGWACIIAGPLLFMLLGQYGGLIPATFACVFVSALGDRTATLKGSLTLAAAITAFGAVLFSYILHVPLPLLRWVAP